MLHGTQLHRTVSLLLALAVVACGGENETPHDERPEPGSEQVLDDAAVNGVDEGDDDATARDGGRDGDPARTGPEPMRVRDAATPGADARTQQTPDAAVPAVGTGDAGRDDSGSVRDAAQASGDAASAPASDAATPLFTPTFHIALRVHRADSGLSGAALASALDEMNEIWWRQAAVCFEVELVRNDEPRADGFDLWFHRSRLGCGASGNGVYCGDHDIHSLDAPSLSPTDSPAWDTRTNPARTAAHELGHGLNLDHYNGFPDSNDSLMSSGRQGFKLHESELTTARRRAQAKARSGAPTAPCAPVPVVD